MRVLPFLFLATTFFPTPLPPAWSFFFHALSPPGFRDRRQDRFRATAILMLNLFVCFFCPFLSYGPLQPLPPCRCVPSPPLRRPVTFPWTIFSTSSFLFCLPNDSLVAAPRGLLFSLIFFSPQLFLSQTLRHSPPAIDFHGALLLNWSVSFD